MVTRELTQPHGMGYVYGQHIEPVLFEGPWKEAREWLWELESIGSDPSLQGDLEGAGRREENGLPRVLEEPTGGRAQSLRVQVPPEPDMGIEEEPHS